MKVIATEWRSAAHTIGFVAYETGSPANPGEWNAVVGYVPESYPLNALVSIKTTAGMDEEDDALYIAQNGAKLSVAEAKVFFPHLDITKHKYYRE